MSPVTGSQGAGISTLRYESIFTSGMTAGVPGPYTRTGRRIDRESVAASEQKPDTGVARRGLFCSHRRAIRRLCEMDDTTYCDGTSTLNRITRMTNRIQQRRDRRTIRGAGTDVMHPHCALRIDEHVAAELLHVGAGSLKTPTSEQQFAVRPPRSRSEDVPPAAAIHSVSRIQQSRLIDQQRPGQTRLSDIRHRHRPGFKSHHADFDAQRGDLAFPLSQLRQMFATGQSPKVAMKHQ